MRGHYASLLALVLLFLCCWVHVGLAAPPPSCHLSVHLEWSARVGAPIHATPLVVDFLHDGHKEILVATQSNFLEALDGSNGGDAAGFPFAHPRLRTYASPLPIDMDGDGSTEWILAMYNGELVVFDERGDARGLLKVPPLAMKKNWRKNHLTAEQAGRVRAAAPNWSAEVIAEMAKARTMKDLFFVRRRPMSEQRTRPRRNVSTTLSPHGDRTSPMAYEDASLEHEDELPNWADDWITDEMDDDRTGEEPFEQERRIGPDGQLSEEAKRSMKLLFQPELYQVMMNKNTTIDESFGLKYIRGAIPFSVESDEIAVDPHILSTPVIADVDGNGDVDIILHMSYFFDEEEYAPGGGHGKKLPEGIIASDYAATAIVCMNLVSGEVKWARTLQVAPRHDPVPAQGLSTPLVLSAAKHNHGKAVIAVTSTDGTLTAFLGDGSPLPGAWPVTMNPILASPTAEDVERRGSTNICTGDTLGQVGCYRMDGTRIWNTTVVGAVADRIVYGDLLGNGEMCVVVVTTAGRIYAFTGSHGKLLPHFPIITGGPIYASPLLMNLQSMTFGTGLHIIVPSHDGHVYLVSPKTGCMDLVDIDEASSTSVLADDVSGNGMMDLIVTTIHGGVYLFETDTPHHPLKVWPSKTKGLNGFTANENNVGILLSEESRRTRDIQGSRFHLKISIVDGRPSTVDASHRIYKVTVFIGSRIRVYESVFTKPGTYSITVRAPFERMYAALTVAMELPNGQVFYDRTSLSFNMFFLETVKISVIVPFLLLASALMLVHRRHAV